jgi:hypothetical protein
MRAAAGRAAAAGAPCGEVPCRGQRSKGLVPWPLLPAVLLLPVFHALRRQCFVCSLAYVEGVSAVRQLPSKHQHEVCDWGCWQAAPACPAAGASDKGGSAACYAVVWR